MKLFVLRCMHSGNLLGVYSSELKAKEAWDEFIFEMDITDERMDVEEVCLDESPCRLSTSLTRKD